ncbi:hypothetical protein Tco_0394064 [Tanacetum coccineum]
MVFRVAGVLDRELGVGVSLGLGSSLGLATAGGGGMRQIFHVFQKGISATDSENFASKKVVFQTSGLMFSRSKMA